jgi:hypothetical protein
MSASRKDPSKPGTKRKKTHGQSISISYDREADVLSLVLDKSTKAEADEIGPGIYARYAWPTGQLAEVCIVGFSRRFQKKSQEIKVPERIVAA